MSKLDLQAEGIKDQKGAQPVIHLDPFNYIDILRALLLVGGRSKVYPIRNVIDTCVWAWLYSAQQTQRTQRTQQAQQT